MRSRRLIARFRALSGGSRQVLAVQVEVDEGEVGAEPVMVLGDASVAHLVEAEDALQDTEDVFYFRSYF